MESYQLFKIILSIIASVLILGFVFLYISGYSTTQQEFRKVKALKAFVSASEGAYLTGNGVDFDDFEKIKETAAFDPSVPGLRMGNFQEPFVVPVLYAEGPGLAVASNELDFGWWKVRYVTALPEMRVLLNPLDNTDGTWGVIEMFVSNMTSSINSRHKVTFAICDARDIASPCGPRGCQRDDFLAGLGSLKKAYGICQMRLDERDRLVMVSVACPETEALCISPSSASSGHLVQGEKSAPYRDAADIIAAVAGGLDAYEYKNRAFFQELGLASMMLANSTLIFSRELRIIGNDAAFAMDSASEDLDRIENRLIPSLEEQKKSLPEEGKKTVDAEIEKLKTVEIPRKKQCITLYRRLNETIAEASEKAGGDSMDRLGRANSALAEAGCARLPKQRQLDCIIEGYAGYRPSLLALHAVAEGYKGLMTDDVSGMLSRVSSEAARRAERLKEVCS